MNTARPIGCFAVTVGGDETRRFAAALQAGMPAHDGRHGVPFTFQLRWLAEENIRDAIVREIGRAGEAAPRLPVHVAQNIRYESPLEIGETYQLEVTIDGPDARNLVRVDGAIMDADGAPVGHLTTTLLMIELPEGVTP